MRHEKLGRSVVIGLVAGVLYGAWAIYANRGHEVGELSRAAATQFLLSFSSTAVLTLMIEFVLARGRSRANLVLAAVGPHAGVIALFMAVHWWSGTPNILRTVAPSALVGLVFCITYVAGRARR
jgi:hypothetical protein